MNIAQQGEEIAAEYLIKNNFKILKRNYHSRYGEVDIIAEKENENEKTLYFFEVKTRRLSSINLPEESITYQKKQRLLRTALIFLQKQQPTKQKTRTKSWRISLIGILLGGGKSPKINILPIF